MLDIYQQVKLMVLMVFQHVFSIKASMPLAAASLTHIFNSVIATGSFPRDWKNARVTLSLKLTQNMIQPTTTGLAISVLSVVSKNFEKAIFNQAYQYLDNNNILAKF